MPAAPFRRANPCYGGPAWAKAGLENWMADGKSIIGGAQCLASPRRTRNRFVERDASAQMSCSQGQGMRLRKAWR